MPGKSIVYKKTETLGMLRAVKRNVTLILLLFLFAVASASAFELNFNRPPHGSVGGNNKFSCDPGINTCGTIHHDGSAIAMYTVKVNGQRYWRTVVGEPSSGFALEFYTRANSAVPGSVTAPRGQGVDGGGMEPSNGRSDNCAQFTDEPTYVRCGNAINPFGIGVGSNVSGIGAQDPTKVVFRMVLSDGGMDQEIYKPIMNHKPKITQTINEPGQDMQSTFIADMRDLRYDDGLTAAKVTNKQKISDINLPNPVAGDFNIAMTQDSNITAGQYTFNPGAGWDVGYTSFDLGTYNYSEGNFDMNSVDWSLYFDPVQNSEYCANSTEASTWHRQTINPLSCPPN
ncbi:MAG: hypothetical protein ACE5EH_08495 [Gammaproteobacteria bacterium]